MKLENRPQTARLFAELNAAQEQHLSPLACLNREEIRRSREERQGYRQPFAQDADRILYSKAYARYIDKTQVFSLVDNDHITHRVLHVQMVSRIARTVGRFLALNEDLIEAIALGHDIGHPPFGHEGEEILDQLCRKQGLAGFHHNIQSVQFLDRFEKQGTGWNLTLQVLDGIVCHNGEVRADRLQVERNKGKGDTPFAALDRLLTEENPVQQQLPMTMEGCVVRLCDTIAYIGRDIEDAIELDLIERSEIPKPCARLLGNSNGTIIHTLVTDLITGNLHVREADNADADLDYIGFSTEIADILQELKRFNYQRIYKNPLFKPDYSRIHHCYEQLFDSYMAQMARNPEQSAPGRSFLHSMSKTYLSNHSPAAIVRDYLAGMTDDFFLRQAAMLGCDTPERTCFPN